MGRKSERRATKRNGGKEQGKYDTGEKEMKRRREAEAENEWRTGR